MMMNNPTVKAYVLLGQLDREPTLYEGREYSVIRGGVTTCKQGPIHDTLIIRDGRLCMKSEADRTSWKVLYVSPLTELREVKTLWQPQFPQVGGSYHYIDEAGDICTVKHSNGAHLKRVCGHYNAFNADIYCKRRLQKDRVADRDTLGRIAYMWAIEHGLNGQGVYGWEWDPLTDGWICVTVDPHKAANTRHTTFDDVDDACMFVQYLNESGVGRDV